MRQNNLFKILFFITVPILLLVATVIVLIISQGASVTNQGIVTTTGVLRINTDPANLQYKVYSDGVLIENLNNKGVNIEEGTHLIRIEATGMAPWEKKVSITRGVVNEIFAKLFPLSMSLTQLTNTNIDRAFFSTAGDFVYYVVKESNFPAEKGIWRMQLTGNNIFFLNNAYVPVKIIDLDKTVLPLINSSSYKIEPSPDNSKILITDSVNKQLILVTGQLLNQQPVVSDLTARLGFYPEYIRWFNNSNSLIIKDKHTLFELNLSTNVLVLIKYAPENELIFGANNDQVLFFDTKIKTLNIYKNQVSTTLLLKNVLIPQDIVSIIIPSGNNRYMAIKNSTAYSLVDLEKSTLTSMLSVDHTLLLQSGDGLAFLFEAPDKSLTTITVTENLGLNKLETRTNKLALTYTENDVIKFNPQSNFLLYFSSAENKIYTFDRDGSNKLPLIDSKNVRKDFNFDNAANNLVVLIQDETQTAIPTVTATATPSQPRINLYRLSLVKTTP